jgi:hypothetical protein
MGLSFNARSVTSKRFIRVLLFPTKLNRLDWVERQFPWMASIAESFRFRCGSERRAPECSTQRIPAATPHVGQGTEFTCLGVSSFFFIPGTVL